MKLYKIEREQSISAPLEAVFSFFSRPENLEVITPPQMRMQVLTPSPIPMRAGEIIDYVVTVGGLPMRWTTHIADYDPPLRFVDLQLRGPYAYWHHTHTFEPIGNITLVRDRVLYGMPFGPLGRLARALFVKRQLEGIFDYRATFLERKRTWQTDNPFAPKSLLSGTG